MKVREAWAGPMPRKGGTTEIRWVEVETGKTPANLSNENEALRTVLAYVQYAMKPNNEHLLWLQGTRDAIERALKD